MKKSKKTSRISSDKKKDGFSIANVISILGLVILAFFLYLGFAYGGTNTGTAILYAVLITIGMGILLYGLLYAKSVEDNFNKWKFVEIALVVIFIIAAGSTVHVMCRFLNVNSESDNLKNYALEDLTELETAIEDFKNYEKNNLSQLEINLQSIAGCENYYSATTQELKDFIKIEVKGDDNEISDSNIKAFVKKWNGHIDKVIDLKKSEYFGESFENAIKEQRDRINAWEILEVPQAIEGIDRLHKELAGKLKSASASYPLHKIGRSGSKYDIVDEHEAFEVSTESNFKDKCNELTDINLKGIAISIIIFLLIIFNYVVAYRSTKVGVKVGGLTRDGGQILKI